MTRGSIAIGALLLGLAAGGACQPRGPNVVLLSVDSLRHDAVRPEVAPTLARLAETSVVFDHAVSPAPWTTPAMMSIMTGLPAPAHGVDEHDRALGEGAGTLAERFRRAGWRTAAFVPEVTLRAEFGFDRGFEEFDEARYGHMTLSSPEMLGRLMQRIERWERERFFLWAHLWDPHYNYTPPAELARRHERGTAPASDDVQCLKWRENAVSPAEAAWLHGRQEAEVEYTDRYVGQVLELLEERGLAERTIVVVVADHGEAFLEHGWLGHTNRLDEAVVRVPLLIRGPGVGGPRTVTRPVSTASLGRTLLALAGLDAKSFGIEPPLPGIGGASAAVPPPLSETRRRGCMTALRDGPLKLLVEHGTCAARLYDVEADPLEREDLAAARAADVARLVAMLGERIAEADAAGVAPARLDAAAAPETGAALRSLGYLPSAPREPGAGRPADPCSVRPGDAAVDSFGDVILDAPCPAAGIRACLPGTR